MCTFCENGHFMTKGTVSDSKPRNDYAELINCYDGDYTTPFNQRKLIGKAINVTLLECGEGAAWDNRTVSMSFPINFCPICGKFLGKTIDIKTLKIETLQ